MYPQTRLADSSPEFAASQSDSKHPLTHPHPPSSAKAHSGSTKTPIPSINIIQPTQMTTPSHRSSSPQSSTKVQGGRATSAPLPDVLQNGLFSSTPLTYLTPEVPQHLRKLFVLHGGRLTEYQDRAKLLLANSSSDPTLAKLYSAPVVVYDSYWIQESFLAGTLLPCGKYAIYPWEIISEEAFFSFTLAELQEAAGIRNDREEIVGFPGSEGDIQEYEVQTVVKDTVGPINHPPMNAECPTSGLEIDLPRRALSSISPNIKHSTRSTNGNDLTLEPTSKQSKIDAPRRIVPSYQMQPKIAVSKRKMPIYVDSVSSEESDSSSPRPSTKRSKRTTRPIEHKYSKLTDEPTHTNTSITFAPQQALGSASGSNHSRNSPQWDRYPHPFTPVKAIPSSPLHDAGIMITQFQQMMQDHVDSKR